MKKALRLLVITENGHIVGTQFVSPPGTVPAVSAVLQPGPRQQVHDIEVEPPLALRTVEQIHAFHEAIAKQIGIDKLYGMT